MSGVSVAAWFSKAAIDGTETSYKAFNRLYEGAIVLSQVKGWRCRCPLPGRPRRLVRVPRSTVLSGAKPGLASDEYFRGDTDGVVLMQLQDATRA